MANPKTNAPKFKKATPEQVLEALKSGPKSFSELSEHILGHRAWAASMVPVVSRLQREKAVEVLPPAAQPGKKGRHPFDRRVKLNAPAGQDAAAAAPSAPAQPDPQTPAA